MTYPTYCGFAAYDDDPVYTIKVPARPTMKKSTGPQDYTATLYRGIPKGQTKETAVDDGRRYLSLGDHIFMATTDFGNLSNDAFLTVIYEKLKRNMTNKEQEPIDLPVWYTDGTLHPMPSIYIVSINRRDSEESWKNRQKGNWAYIMETVGVGPRKKYSPGIRLSQPDMKDVKGFKFVFSPSENETDLSLAQLKKHVEGVKGNPYPYSVLSWSEASADPNLVLLSSSIYGFYHTWISPNNYHLICEKLETVPLERPWPNQATAIQIDGMVGPADQSQMRDTETVVTAQKIGDASGSEKRGQVLSQQQVMNNVSATTVANLCGWDGGKAEWLHRSAFSLGGLGSTTSLGSSQTRGNLVFGSKEANDVMIRDEDTIVDLVGQLGSRKYKPRGVLVTENVLRGELLRRDTHGRYTRATIPDWFENRRKNIRGSLLWLCFQLKYRFTMNDPGLNINLSGTTEVDPFSRFTPFRIESKLDTAIVTSFVADRVAAAGPSTSKKPKLAIALLRDMQSTLRPSNTSSTPHLSTPPPLSLSSLVKDNYPSYYRVTHAPPIPTHIWRSVLSGALSVEVHGTLVHSPMVHAHVLDETISATSILNDLLSNITSTQRLSSIYDPPPDGFTLKGEIDLFGLTDLRANLYVWSGVIPPEATIITDPPIYDKALLDGDFKLSSVLPILESTPFNNIVLRNVTFTYQNFVCDPTRAVGWHVNGDFVIEPSCGLLYDVLRTVLNVQEPTVHVHAGLGLNQGWGKPLSVSSFALDGLLPGVQLNVCKGFTLTSVGVELLGIHRVERYPKPRSVIDYGFAIFGSFNIDLPGSVTPLELDYTISEIGGYVHLCAEVGSEGWVEPLGIKGLSFMDVTFDAGIVLGSPMTSFDFDVQASFNYRMTSAIFAGSYSSGGKFSLTAELDKFSLSSINDIFECLTGGSLAFPDIDVQIESATMTIASHEGLTIALQGVRIEGHSAVSANALLSIGPTGVLIRGDISGEGVTFGEVDVKKAYIQIDLRKGADGSGVMIGGEVDFEGMKLDALVHLYKGANKGLEWTVFASLSTSGDALALSKLVPELKGTFLDLALSQAVFVVASQDDPQVATITHTPYSFHQGVQICATVSPIAALDSLMRSPSLTSGLVLNAGWSKAAGFTLDIQMPTVSVVNLGRGIVTDPFTLRIQANPPTLLLIAGVQVPVEPSGERLDFKMSLGINPIGASATAEMHGYWTNPLGLGENVKLGPDIALSIDIIFAQFLSTGTPSGFGVVAGLAIGKVTASIAMEINENPMRELLKGEVKALDINDLVSFANTVTGLSISQPPNFLDFEDVKLYICPSGTTIGTMYYPQGFSFQSVMSLFGKRAEIACSVGSTGVIVKGGVDNFTLGPLTVRGVNDPRATIDVDISPASQQIDIDGMVTFFDAQAAVAIKVDVLPNPLFSFFTTLQFTEMLKFQLDAKLIGELSFQSLDNADFTFYAALEQHILQYVQQQIDIQFDTACKAAHEGFEKAKKDLTDAEDAIKQQLDNAQHQVDVAEAAWEKKSKEVTESSQKVIDAYLGQLSLLQSSVRNAQRAYDDAMAGAQSALQQANNSRSQALSNARNDLESSRRRAQSAIDDALREVQYARNTMDREFGNAERNIQNARDSVNSLQRQIDSVQRDINWYNNLPWYDPRHGAVAGLYPQLAALQAAKATADGVLYAAQAVVRSSGYLASQAAIHSAELALQTARDQAPRITDAAKRALDAVDSSTAVIVRGAEDALRGVERGVEFIALEGAKNALETFKSANMATFDAAQGAIENLLSTAEYVAFEAARTGLDAAKQATSIVDGLKGALDVAEQLEELALKISQWVAQHLTNLVDIQKIELSGTLRDMIGQNGDISKPFTAHVEYVLAGQSGNFDGHLDLKQTAGFITNIFNQMWNEIAKIV